MDLEKITGYLFNIVSDFGAKLISAILVLFIGLKLIKLIKRWIKNSQSLDKLDVGVRTFFSSFAGISLYILLFSTNFSIDFH